MKKYLIAILVLVSFFSIASQALAVATSWDYSGGVVKLLQSQRTAEVKVPYITSTSTTATSTLNRLSVPTFLTITGNLRFNNVTGNSWDDFCTTITGSSDLCDGIDAGTTYTAGDALTLTGTDFDFDGGATPSGDLGGTWASPSVTDDSHSHTGSTLSGIDISSDTNLTVSATGLQLSSDAVALAAGYIIPLTASTTAWNGFYNAPSGRITAGDGLTWSTNTLNFDGGNTPAGDLGGTWASPSVTDDSHAHTGSTISSIDISSDTNLAGDSEVVLTGDALSLAASIARDVELHAAVTLSGALDYITLVGQDIVRGAIDLATDITGVLSIANGGLGAAFTDPNADQVMFWDDSAAKITGIASLVGATISGTTLTIDDVTCTGCLGATEIAGLGTADISGLDVSDDLNLTAGRSLTLTGDDVLADAELYTDTKTIYFESPVAADDFKTLWTAPQAATITAISCESDQTVNFDLQVDDGSPTGVNGSDIACTTFATDSSLAGDTTMASGDRLDLALTSVSGTPTWVSISFRFTYDD